MASSTAPQIHVFDQGNYASHRLVTLPTPESSPLAPSSLRLKTRLLGLTTNNLTYANLGFALGWWDIYPIPENAPAPYNDRKKYATIAGWGYADVVESTVPSIPAGKSAVYGYLHVGNGTWNVSVEETDVKGHILVTSPHRQHLWKIYNRLTLHPASVSALEQEKGEKSLAYDPLMLPLFGTGYNLNLCGFAWDEEYRIHPFGEGAWSAEDASLDGAVAVVLNAGGKTGMAFAWAVRHARPEAHQPLSIIGVGSQRSRDLISGCGFYDEVLENGDANRVREIVERKKPAKVVLLDFGARPGVLSSFTDALSAPSANVPLQRLFIGGDNRPAAPQELMAARGARGEGVQVNANLLREKGVSAGGEKYFEVHDKAWERFKGEGGVKGMEIVWGEGMEGWERGWEAFCRDEVGSGEGRVYRL